ncbi:MAG: hypothetical protein H7834_15080 [Magnetococcus sp. YQC-9]
MTHAAKLTSVDERIDFTEAAQAVRRRILALYPWPGAVAMIDGQPIKLLGCRLGVGSGAPGESIARQGDGLEIACGQGSIVITELQQPGKRRMAAVEWLRGRIKPHPT